MPDKNVGAEILTYCGSCKMDLMATIVAKEGAKVAKVQCKTCKKERAYKAPKGVSDPSQAPAPSKRKSASAANAVAEASAKAVAVETEWNRLMAEAAAKANANKVKYTLKAKLSLGDIVQHPSFGDGVVMRIAHPDKAEIIFKTDVKLLIHSRS